MTKLQLTKEDLTAMKKQIEQARKESTINLATQEMLLKWIDKRLKKIKQEAPRPIGVG